MSNRLIYKKNYQMNEQIIILLLVEYLSLILYIHFIYTKYQSS